MNLKELFSPIRLYWDIAPVPGYASIDYAGICDQIVSNKILSLQVTEYAPILSDACLTILDRLKDSSMARSLTASRSALNESALISLSEKGLKVLFVAISSEGEIESALDISRQVEGSIPVGISFSLTRNNYHDIADVISFCIARKISHLSFPMQRVMRETDCFYLTRQEGRRLAAAVQAMTLPADLKLIIHDPFLWRAVYPSVPFPDGGCQAANTMLYISPEADVYPCPTVPVKIGNLCELSLKEVIRSDAKKEARQKLISGPQACRSCVELVQCKGGCRGRAYAIRRSWEEADPACR